MLIVIRSAILDDSDAVLTLLTGVAASLQSRGINQWTEAMFTLDGMHRAIKEHNVFIATIDDQAVGTVRIQWSDPVIWGECRDSADAAYIHRLAVCPKFTGHGIGRKLLDFAEGYAKNNGKTLLRLDCWGENHRLMRYCIDAGFRHIDTTEESILIDNVPQSTWSVARFDKKIV
jgi:GNAT superfamily N-acetyltransferase